MNIRFAKAVQGLSVAICVALCGCGPEIKDPRTYPAVDMAPTDLPPGPTDLHPKQLTFVVVPVTGTGPNADYGDYLTSALEQRLVSAGFKVMDRALAAKLGKELFAAEKSGKLKHNGDLAADVAVLANIMDAGAGSSYVASSTTYDKKGQAYTSPAACSYSGSAKFTVRGYRIPSMDLVKNVQADGSTTSSQDGTNPSCPVPPYRDSLIHKAIDDGVDHQVNTLLNQFAPTGYVLERHDVQPGGTNVLYLTNLTALDGAAVGGDVAIKRKQKVVNPITHDEDTRLVELATGKFQFVDPQESWIYVTGTKDLTDQIRMGDVVEVQHHCAEGETYSSFFKMCNKAFGAFVK